MTFDIERARRETPGCGQVIHLNNAGASLPPTVVLNTIVDHLTAESRVGGYEAEEEAQERLERVYDSIAALLSCRRDEIALTESATRAWDMAFYALRFEPGDRILTAKAEYASNAIAFLQTARHRGARVEVVPDDAYGQLSVAALRALIDDRVKLIAISHVPTHGGLVNPAEEIGRVAREAGVLYLLDACQSVGQMPLDVTRIGCHILSGTGRKFLRGPRGTGFLYVERALAAELEPPFLDLHAATWTAPWEYEVRPDARRFESWESYVAGRLGLGAAVDYAREWGLDQIWQRVTRLAERARQRLEAIPGVRIRDVGRERCAIVTFTKAHRDPEQIVRALAARRINVNAAYKRASQFDFPERGLEGVVRASVHYFNTDEEIDTFTDAVAAA